RWISRWTLGELRPWQPGRRSGLPPVGTVEGWTHTGAQYAGGWRPMRLLVRHAHAGNKRHWSGPDAERPLSIRGWAQAGGLLEPLGDLRGERLLTSLSLRCRQTLLPLAAALDLDLEPVDDLGIDGDIDRLVHLLDASDRP